MTSDAQLVTILTTWVSLFLLIVVLRLWSSLRLDRFRQSMFALRDEVFDYAAAENISFNDPAYRLLRKSMNGFIRYAHQLTFFRISLMMLYWTVFDIQPKSKWWDSWTQALDDISDDRVKNDLFLFHQKAVGLVATRLVLGSPVLMALLVAVACRFGIRSLKEAVDQSLKRFIDPKILDEEAANAAA